MFCPKCSKFTPDGSRFCAVCGAPIDTDGQKMPQFVYEDDDAKDDTPAEGTAKKGGRVYYDYGKEFSGTRFNKNKRRRRVITLVGTLTAIAVIAVLVLVNLNAIVGFSIKTFASPDKYFAYVVGRQAAASGSAAMAGYADVFSQISKGFTSDGRLEIALGDKLKDELEQNGSSADWAEDFYIDVKSSHDGSNSMSKIGFYVGDQLLGSYDIYLDSENERQITGFGGITDSFLYAQNSSADIAGILPEEKELSDILTRYSKIIRDNSTGIQKATEDFTIDGVVEKLVMLELNFGRSDTLNTEQALITQMKEDEQLLGIIDRISEYLSTQSGTGLDLRTSFSEWADARLEHIQNARTDMDIEVSTLRFRVFVNGSHEIVGVEITVNSENVIYCVTTRDGKDFGTEMRLGSEIDVLGYGTVQDGETNATYDVTEDGADLMTITLENVSDTSGTVTVLPTPRFYYNHVEPSSSELATMGAGFSVYYDIGKRSGDYIISILSDGKKYISFDLSYDTGELQPFEIPDKNLYNTEDSNERAEFLRSCDFDSLTAALKENEFPQSVISYFELYNTVINMY